MNYTETQLSAIKLFGRKDLEFGCIFKYGYCYTRYCHPGTSFHIVQKLNSDTYAIGNEDFKKIEILGHEPHLENLFRVAEERGIGVWQSMGTFMRDGLYFYKNQDPILKLYTYNPTLPLLDQPNLSDIISLFR